MTITANELKTRGVSSLEDTVNSDGCAIITVHGKDKYAVLRIEDYNKLRELELDLIIQEDTIIPIDIGDHNDIFE